MYEPFFVWKYRDYFKAAVEAPTYRIAFEFGLIILVIFLYFKKMYRLDEGLTLAEEEELISEWKPTPLFEPSPPVEDVVVQGKGKFIKVNGKDCINFSSYNFCDLNNNVEDAIKALGVYGPGSCGPRGFYGTMECHANLENTIAEWLGAESAILYSVACCCISSVIPSCISSRDCLFIDEACSEWVAYGAKISRARIYFYKHHDWDHLDELLSTSPCCKRFIVAEAVNHKYCDVIDLPRLIELKYKHKARLIIDESLSIGVLSPKGLTKDIQQIDMLIMSLEYSFGSLGGFCLGHSSIIHHQRLAGHAYCFSASCPPFTLDPIFERLHLIQEQWRFDKIRQNTDYLRDKLTLLEQFEIGGDPRVPIIMLYHKDTQLLKNIVKECRNRGIALVLQQFLTPYYSQMSRPTPSIKITVNCVMELCDIDNLVNTINDLSSQKL